MAVWPVLHAAGAREAGPAAEDSTRASSAGSAGSSTLHGVRPVRLTVGGPLPGRCALDARHRKRVAAVGTVEPLYEVIEGVVVGVRVVVGRAGSVLVQLLQAIAVVVDAVVGVDWVGTPKDLVAVIVPVAIGVSDAWARPVGALLLVR